jgi:hypothetical protein
MQNLEYYLDWKVLGYAGHVERMDENRIPKQLRDAVPFGKKKVGGQSKSYLRQLFECLKRKNIEKTTWKILAADKNAWRKAIREFSVPVKKSTRSILCAEKIKYRNSPDSLLGIFVEKKFRNKWHVGQITDFDECEASSDIIWNVVYDDGDQEDYFYEEISKIICRDMGNIL